MTKAAELAKMGEVLTNSQIGGRRNIIINGAMQVAQRGTSETGVTDSGYKNACDRWHFNNTSSGTWTVSKSTTVPNGEFKNSFKINCTTADATVNTTDQIAVEQRIEAQDITHLAYGSSDAKKVTCSFWVRSTKTGTFTLEMYVQDSNRTNAITYTIDSADTWEHKTLTFVADTGGSGVTDDNGIGCILKWWLTTGSFFNGGTQQVNTWVDIVNANRVNSSIPNLADSTDNEWYITGVQLEVGEQATPFEHRSFGEEFALCQRYFQKSVQNGQTSYPSSGGYASGMYLFPVRMRADPTGAYTDGGAGGSSIGNSTNVDGFFNNYGSLAASEAGSFSWTMTAEL